MRDCRSFAFQRKEELHTVVIVLYAALLIMSFHDRLYDRESDSASAVFPGAGFIYLIELVPYLIYIRLIVYKTGTMDTDTAYAYG